MIWLAAFTIELWTFNIVAYLRWVRPDRRHQRNPARKTP
jgi:hypothetical protein